jgi:uncharacterized protein YfdQ (DUF2303 family)
MFDKQAIETLAKAQAIGAAATAVQDAMDANGAVALPKDFEISDLEHYQSNRRHMRGKMGTRDLSSFWAYVNAHAEEGCTVFISTVAMKAEAVLNLGVPEKPGHADNIASFNPEPCSEYAALSTMLNTMRSHGGSLKQADAAEFIEDWADCIRCKDEAGQEVRTPVAISALRKLTIESMSRKDSAVEQLSTTQSTMEQVQAKSTDTIPSFIEFSCTPYPGFKVRSFVMRVGIRTGDKAPTIAFRPIRKEAHDEEMAQELAALVANVAPPEHGAEIIIGSYSRGT